MTNKICIAILDELTINQIAAGEVVENSSSVVKELVENSIDAKASEVYIESLAGGQGLVKVADNGIGMNQEELLLALQRHATSKILKAEDLEKIGTLGFRGEALPSIASISKMRLHSEVLVEVEGGKVLSVKNVPRPQGTTIEVHSLFYNAPVRRKFQKSVGANVAAIHRVLTHMALCNQQVQFKWISEQEERLFVEKGSDLRSRILALLGEDFLSKEIDHQEGAFRIQGFLGRHRPNRTGQYLFVNKRLVTSPWIAQKVLEGYSTRIPVNRYPLFVLHLELPQELVDVNVHPQKKEVRFQQREAIGAFVRKSVDQALQIKPKTYEFRDVPQFFSAVDDHPKEWEFPQMMIEPEISLPQPQFQALGVVGSFLLLEDPKGILVVDLNKARSLLLNEQEEEIQEQRLLIPVMLEFSAAEADLIKEQLPQIQKKGFSLSHFGGNTYACDAIPSCLEQEEVKSVILELLEGKEKRRKYDSLRKSRFTLQEGRYLVEELFKKELEKEAMSLIKIEELAKRFS